MLLVTPYYNKPGPAGVLHHFTEVARATDLPVMLYDVPGRTGSPIAARDLRGDGRLETVVARQGRRRRLRPGVALRELGYASTPATTHSLGWLAHGGCGFVSVVGHVVGDQSAP